MMQTKLLFTLIVGVGVILGSAQSDQSDPSLPDDQPIGTAELVAGERRLATPEVVLQLKYESGELNRIYLAQFRKAKESWTPSVPARTNLCADLCHAGLGGKACGGSCSKMLPVGLQTALQNPNHTGAVYGQPRVAVCPTLCENHLGQPLCSCGEEREEEIADAEAGAGTAPAVEWNSICSAFCLTDRYVLGGCPACEQRAATTVPVQMAVARVLDTTDGWTAWCNVQCVQGQGGAACNCDRAPFQ